MESQAAEPSERVETTVLDLARSMAQHVEASDVRVARVEANLMKLSDALGNFARSMSEYVAASDARLSRIEENVGRLEANMTRMERDLGELVRAVTAGRGPSQPEG